MQKSVAYVVNYKSSSAACIAQAHMMINDHALCINSWEMNRTSISILHYDLMGCHLGFVDYQFKNRLSKHYKKRQYYVMIRSR